MWIGFVDFMFPGKTLFDYTSLFSPYDFEKKMVIKFLVILKFNKHSFIEAINTSTILFITFWYFLIISLGS